MLESARTRGTIFGTEREDSLRALDHDQRSVARESERLARQMRDSLFAASSSRNQRARAMRRDSAIAVFRARDSAATVARAWAKYRDEVRRDSLNALHERPRLDTRPSVGGRPVGTDGDCYCHIEGRIEVRSSKPMDSPMRATVQVRGRPSNQSRVMLFMGAPREFVLGRVPCGTVYLDVLLESGRRYAVEKETMLGPYECGSGILYQPRITLVPR